MNIQRIDELVRSMPPDAPFYTNMGGGVQETQSQLVDRLGFARNDPSFPWTFVAAFVNMRQRLPCEVTEHFMRQAYEFTLNNVPNNVIANTFVLRHTEFAMTRCMLEALLLISEFPEQENPKSDPMETIAEISNINVNTVRMYEKLFFNVRDRLDDLNYMHSILYPETRQVEIKPDYFLNEHPGKLMLRASLLKDGTNVETIMSIYGTRYHLKELSAEVYTRNLTTRVLADAHRIIQSGGSNQPGIPSVSWARSLTVAREMNKDSGQVDAVDSQMGVGAIGLNTGQSILETVKNLTNDATYEKQLEEQKWMEANRSLDKKGAP
jgi:hypothetical protein